MHFFINLKSLSKLFKNFQNIKIKDQTILHKKLTN